MSKKKAFKRLKRARKFAQDNSDTDYLLVHKTGSTPEIGGLDFPATVQQEINKLLVDSMSDLISEIFEGKKDLRPFRVANSNLDEPIIECQAISSLPNSDLFQAIVSDKPYPTTKLDMENKPDFQLIRVTDGDQVLVGIQNSQSIQVYDDSDGLSLLYDNEMYTKFDGDLFIVPQSINAICFDGMVYIRTHKSFEKLFEIREEYERQAENVIDRFNKSGITFANQRLENEWLVGDIRILRKMFEVRKNKIPKYATPDKIEEVIEKYEVGVEYQRKNGQIELDIERYQDVWELLRLLNDDYAEAEIIPDGKLEINQKRFI